jgi:hypothetical protein
MTVLDQMAILSNRRSSLFPTVLVSLVVRLVLRACADVLHLLSSLCSRNRPGTYSLPREYCSRLVSVAAECSDETLN